MEIRCLKVSMILKSVKSGRYHNRVSVDFYTPTSGQARCDVDRSLNRCRDPELEVVPLPCGSSYMRLEPVAGFDMLISVLPRNRG